MCGREISRFFFHAVALALAATAFSFSQDVGKYSGPGSCAASNCHGSVSPRTTTTVRQNEYSIWASQDRHGRAYTVLSNSTSLRMGKILKLSTQPNQAPKCRACHTLDVPQNLKAQTFQGDEGVSCENCHGPAVGWLGPHTTKGWNRDQSIKLGQYETRDLAARSERCMTCHVGTPEKRVDHEMYAAGHPPLGFELDTYSFSLPRHWKFPKEGEAWADAQEWAIGQAVELREALNRLSRSAAGKSWPEYAELDCYACHHSLTSPQDSWRQARGYAGRDPGAPAWNLARYVVFRHLVDQVNPQGGRQLEEQVEKLSTLVGSRADREQIAAAAKQASSTTEQVEQAIRRQSYNGELTAKVMQAIAGDATFIAQQGYLVAAEAYMALDDLNRAYQKNEKTGNAAELQAAIKGLFDLIKIPTGYSAPMFAAQMQKVKALLPGVKQASLKQDQFPDR
jgi:Cytochrome c554 and c-prime